MYLRKTAVIILAMPILQVLATRPHSGKTTMAVALGQGLAQNGARVRLMRLGSGDAATADAATFAECLFASASPLPVSAEDATRVAPNETAIVEADAGATPIDGAACLLVVRGAPTADDFALAKTLGDRLVGTIATAIEPTAIEDVARELTNTGLRALAVIPEDRVLAAPSVGEIRQALGAQVLYAGENELVTVEDILIGPVYADPARPHFRRFDSKAVLAPYQKTDLHLAAIETQAACLVITGGHQPSPYVIDRAQGENTTVLLTSEETPETLTALSDVWLTSRFRPGRKLERVTSYLDGRIDFASLARKINGT